MLEGSCHCGAVRIRVPARPRGLKECNCSICRRYGALWGYFRRDRVKISAGKATLSYYAWGAKTLRFGRCGQCGCVTHWMPTSPAGTRMGVNFRNFDPSDISAVRVRLLDGADTWKRLDLPPRGGSDD